MKNLIKKSLFVNKLRKLFIPSKKTLINRKYRDTNRFNIFLSEYKTVYFFIPKIASSSLKKTCAMLLNLNQDSKIQDFHKIDFPSILRSSLLNNDRYFKFAFVRNPYDRLVSFYSNKVIGERNFQKNKSWKYKPFEDFIKIICDIPDETMNVHFKPQHTFITDAKGALLVDYVGKFEKIDEDFEIIKKRAGLPDNLELPHKQTSKHKIYQDYYSEETKKLVAKRYEKDFLMFNYSF